MPAPSPAHTCCFAAHQAPALTQFAPPPVALDAFDAVTVTADSVRESRLGVSVPVPLIDTSPPLTIVLRI